MRERGLGGKMKIYYVCEYIMPDWYYCYGVLDNGFCFGQHVCSHPCFAPEDLLLGRKNRIKSLKEIFDLDMSECEQETIVVKSKEDVPSWWEEHSKLQDSLKPMYEKYEKLCEDYKECQD